MLVGVQILELAMNIFEVSISVIGNQMTSSSLEGDERQVQNCAINNS